MENDNNKELLKKRIQEEFTEDYLLEMRSFASSPKAFHVLPRLLMEGVDATAADAYRNTLETEVIGESIASLIADGNCRENLLELTRGSILGDALPQIYEKWDNSLSKEASAQLLADLLGGLRNHIDEAREVLLAQAQDENSDVEALLEELLFNNDSINRS